MAENAKLNWQPIGFLPQLVEMIDGMLESTTDNLQTLRKAQPASLDNATVNRVIRVNTNLLEDLWLYGEQLKIWQTGYMSEKEEKEVVRLQSRLVKLEKILKEILGMKDKLEEMTIEYLLGKSDLKSGLDFLLNKINFRSGFY